MASCDPAVPVVDARLGVGTKEQLLDWEDEEDGVAELEEDEDDEEEAVEAPATTVADIPPLPLVQFPLPPPMVES